MNRHARNANSHSPIRNPVGPILTLPAPIDNLVIVLKAQVGYQILTLKVAESVFELH